MEKFNFYKQSVEKFETYSLIPATEDDFDFAYQLKKVAYKEYVEQTWGWDEEFQINFHKENFSVQNTKIITIRDKPIGTVDVKEENERIFVSGLYILPEYQSKGIGSSIISALQKKAAATEKR